MKRTLGIGAPLVALAVGIFAIGLTVHAAPPRITFANAPNDALASSPSTPSPAPSTAPSTPPSPTPTTGITPGAGAFSEVMAYLRDRGDDAAIAATDLKTGATVTFNGSAGFHTASIVKVDILATLLLQHQDAHTSVTSSEDALATRMITQSDNSAASALWTAVGGATGVSAANRTFKMTETRPGTNGNWGATITTANDQLRLLKLLATSDSPLSASSRAYELGLMSQVISSQRWGVPTAADSDAKAVYVKNGWYPFDSGAYPWTINSLGEIVESGHTYLVAVLTDGNATMDSGVQLAGECASIAVASLGVA